MTRPHTDLRAAAERAVDAYEAIRLGEPIAAAHEAACLAIEDLRGPASVALFPRYVPATADMIALFEFRETGWERATYHDRCAELHMECYQADPRLAAFLRSGSVVDRVALAGAGHAAATAQPAERGADEFVERYERLIAAQLSLEGAAAYEPHATILGVHVPTLLARLQACRARHDAYRLAETERIDREQRAALEAAAAREQTRRQVVAVFFEGRAGQSFTLAGGRRFSGAGVAAMARRQGARDLDDGYFAGESGHAAPTLDELELVMRKAHAAEAVTS